MSKQICPPVGAMDVFGMGECPCGRGEPGACHILAFVQGRMGGGRGRRPVQSNCNDPARNDRHSVDVAMYVAIVSGRARANRLFLEAHCARNPMLSVLFSK